MNKIKIKLILFFLLFIGFLSINGVNAEIPRVNCYGLPGCTDGDAANPGAPGDNFTGIPYLTKIIGTTIQYVAVLSVVVVMISGIMYMISGGEEEKVKKAKKWMTWSLLGVFLSISAWSIITILNTFRF